MDLKKSFEVQRWVLFPVQSLRGWLSAPPISSARISRSGEKGQVWSWTWGLSCTLEPGPSPSEGMEVLCVSGHANLHSFSHGSACLELDAAALLPKG